jgi:hypothetical protein
LSFRRLFQKAARVRGAEPRENGISFLLSFFLCTFGLKEKSVLQGLISFPQGVALQPTRFFEKKRGKKL